VINNQSNLTKRYFYAVPDSNSVHTYQSYPHHISSAYSATNLVITVISTWFAVFTPCRNYCNFEMTIHNVLLWAGIMRFYANSGQVVQVRAL